ncbi:MAG: hypothetical protein ACKOF9_13940 [Burkholderiales bacterium]
MKMAKSEQSAAISYRFQRYFESLLTGHYLMKQSHRRDPVRVFFNQGCLDSACGLHVCAAICVIFDLAKSIALEDMAKRQYGMPALVFQAFEKTYFTGVNPKEFVSLMESLKQPLSLTLREAASGDLDRWLVDCLMRGELVAIVTASAKNTSRNKHWSLAVGIEGLTVGREHRPDTILMLCPSSAEPNFRPHNARLKVVCSGPGSDSGKAARRLYQANATSSSHKRLIWQYESESFASEAVVLVAAVRIRKKAKKSGSAD